MHLSPLSLPILLLLPAAFPAAASPHPAPQPDVSLPRHPKPAPASPWTAPLVPRDGHPHGHSAPKVHINETDVQAPTPPSYYSIDFGHHDSDDKRYPALMALHIAFMSAAFFGALPAGIALRSVKHSWHGLSMILFWVFVVLGCSASSLYRKLTPNMYEGQKHTSQSYFILLLAVVVSAVDLIATFNRLLSYVRNESFSLRTFWKYVVLGQNPPLGYGAEYINLVVGEPEELEEDLTPLTQSRSFTDAAQWADDVHEHDYPATPASERTLAGKVPFLRRLGSVVFATLERSLVFAGLAQFVFGVAVYTGGCRGNYLNRCLAHLIKGGIFWCYGLVTFARFLGSFSDKGWAWNRAPVGTHVSAEFVESAVILFYGITNTWMERFGARPGDPYTTKQVQHISIAVMFWFAGLVGMGLESRRIRQWLAAISTSSLKDANARSEIVAEPASYAGSFNPFPAVVIGVTGAAMSVHHQKYVFQVQIHALWGFFLVGFAVLRCLTYFFVWLCPPRSILPSRPPSEALASFFLACGGLSFILSDDEITLAAMRQGHDDVMMFLNFTVAATCSAFCWTLCVVAFQGWLKSRTHAAVAFHPSA
ncbi:hypothetical protein FA95DRAFT_1552946 [Auriscalpium vulgare]|uniref:Uncharacterized protein n=1 Tax=Auriscalpium vulgare TaxID=40419 RepID=A0ACB8S9I2_9AGAM|nr:hypothetical protein FA95DRAFT_1552946 [Auriscalpium vulgare]